MAILRTFLMSMGRVAPAGDLQVRPATGFKFGPRASLGFEAAKKRGVTKKKRARHAFLI